MLEDRIVELRTDSLRVSCSPAAGFVIVSIRDGVSGADALWRRESHEPAACARALGAPGEESVATFLDLFVGGWFEMFPAVGHHGSIHGVPTLLHGEVVRLPWTVLEQSETAVEARVQTLRTPFEVVRRIELVGDTLVYSGRIRNLGRETAPYLWGQHPCFDRSTFASGTIEIDVAEASVPGPAYDEANSTLVVDQRFTWPNAQSRGGAAVDLSAIPARADGRHEHVVLTPRTGAARLTAPAVGRAFTLEFDLRSFPYVLLWQDFRAPGQSFWGAADTFTLEPSSNPGRSVDDAVAAGAVRYLEPGAEVSAELKAGWSAL